MLENSKLLLSHILGQISNRYWGIYGNFSEHFKYAVAMKFPDL